MNLLELSGLRLASEAEQSTGVFNVERERVYYARLKDTSVLKRAYKSEYHEQFQVKLEGDTNTRLRVRKTIEQGDFIDYVMTVKVDQDTQDGITAAKQTAVQVSPDMFHMLLLASGGMGMRKKRYLFRVDGLPQALEVDVFVDAQGSPTSDWVKVDYEPKADEAPSQTDLLTLFNRVIDGAKQSVDECKIIDQLYKDVFITDLRP